jgi:hypothetical protein
MKGEDDVAFPDQVSRLFQLKDPCQRAGSAIRIPRVRGKKGLDFLAHGWEILRGSDLLQELGNFFPGGRLFGNVSVLQGQPEFQNLGSRNDGGP